MILADKIIKLRKQLGWSQEELAEKLGVSRQSVSKWESTQSIPDLNKIIKLAGIFGVSTDFLIKDELEAAEFVGEHKEESLRQINLEQALSYITNKQIIANLTLKGAIFCVCSPAPLFFLLALMQSGKFSLSPEMAALSGIVVLLIMVAYASSFFVRINQYQSDIASIENDKFELSYGVHGVINEKQQNFHSPYSKKISSGIALFIFSIIPFLTVAIASGRPDMTLLMLAIMFPIVAFGLSFILPASAELDAYKLLLNEGDLDKEKSAHQKNAENLGQFYWPMLVAIYLGWSLWTMDWGVTWIVFPVGAVAFAALTGLMELIKRGGAR